MINWHLFVFILFSEHVTCIYIVTIIALLMQLDHNIHFKILLSAFFLVLCFKRNLSLMLIGAFYALTYIVHFACHKALAYDRK